MAYLYETPGSVLVKNWKVIVLDIYLDVEEESLGNPGVRSLVSGTVGLPCMHPLLALTSGKGYFQKWLDFQRHFLFEMCGFDVRSRC